jgi:hypothetical protein
LCLRCVVNLESIFLVENHLTEEYDKVEYHEALDQD